ncbi:MAG TPA: ethanolamine utilization protein EutN [Clostridiales bacterium]|nr:ethanolamine utilization protein EutN [Clostridiales bacterium]
MKIAKVVGNVVSTIKDKEFEGYKLLIIRYLDLRGNPVGGEHIALDAADAGIGDIVLANNDGGAAAMILADKNMVADDTVCGVIDCFTVRGKTVKLK